MQTALALKCQACKHQLLMTAKTYECCALAFTDQRKSVTHQFMKTNHLPKMTPVLLNDRDGHEVVVDVKVFALAGVVSVFLSDKTADASGLISRNAACYLAQLIQRLGVHPASTRFYRHVNHPQQGSLFGRFDIVWDGDELASYKFVMLSNLDEGKNLKEWIAKATNVPITYGQTRNIYVAPADREISPVAS